VYISGGPAVNDGQWHHLVGVRAGSALRLYVDTVLAASATDAAVGYTATGAALTLGGLVDGSYAFDSVAIYNRGLSAYDVAPLYAGAGAGPQRGNGVGVVVRDGASANTVGGSGSGAGNLISENAGTGVRVAGPGTTGNAVQGNRIGTNAAGTAAVPSDESGVQVEGGAHDNTIGGTAAEARNVIGGNGQWGVRVTDTGTTGTVIAGNYIGLNAAGTAAVANTYSGVYVQAGADGTRIGGTISGAGNVIGGNSGHGVLVAAGAAGAVIQGNRIGTNAAGTAALANFYNGIEVAGSDTLIGGTTVAARNVVAASGQSGILLNGPASGNRVWGNWVGLLADGTAGPGAGLFAANGVEAGGSNNQVGGDDAADGAADGVIGACNVIAVGRTLWVLMGGSNNTVRGNYMGTDPTVSAVPFQGAGGMWVSTALANWLAATFPNLYGALAGQTNAEVADLYTKLFKRTAHTAPGGPPKLDAQVMATSLAAYVTTQSLAGTAGVAYGFLVTEAGVGTRTYDVGDRGVAFGVANGTSVSVLDLLLAVNERSRSGLLYDADGSGTISDAERALRAQADDVFASLNELGGI
jgi:hypothetical protein